MKTTRLQFSQTHYSTSEYYDGRLFFVRNCNSSKGSMKLLERNETTLSLKTDGTQHWLRPIVNELKVTSYSNERLDFNELLSGALANREIYDAKPRRFL